MTPMLELRGVTKLYGKAPVVESVDFSLMPGEVDAILRENGAGKINADQDDGGRRSNDHR